ncbi:LuxR C-terminal-related transcriptional regulator [Kitasatospora sp. NPDC057015]|uniref:LuxR C-terminal-related transcriptional regulator n=1 Tax=Kitasatospora sp. NPDC057015 TaxID=3346001 RepID=UPI003638258D
MSGISAPRVEIDPTARDLYMRLASTGRQPTGDDQEALWVLLDLGLVRKDADLGHVLVDPGFVGARWEASLYSSAAAVMHQAAEVRTALDELRTAFHARRDSQAAGVLEFLRGSRTINARLDQIIGTCKEEFLVCQPSRSRTRDALDESRSRDLNLVRTGVSVRHLYHAEARSGTALQDWVSQMTEHGAEVRTLDEDFQRMMIIDRTTAVIPGDSILTASESATAYVVKDPGVASFLAEVFCRDWARADPWHRTGPTGLLTDREDLILRHLAADKSYEAIARSLGVTQRTVASDVALIKEKLQAGSLFSMALAWKGLLDTSYMTA